MTSPTLRGAVSPAFLAMPVPALADEAADLIRQFCMVVRADSPGSAAYGAMLAEDLIDNDQPQIVPPEGPDRDVTLALLAGLEQAFPEAVNWIELLEPIGNDRAIVYWTSRGRQEGPFFDARASGRDVCVYGVVIFRAEGGQFVERWHVEEPQSPFAQIASVE